MEQEQLAHPQWNDLGGGVAAPPPDTLPVRVLPRQVPHVRSRSATVHLPSDHSSR